MRKSIFIIFLSLSILSCKNSNSEAQLSGRDKENIENQESLDIVKNTENLTDSIQVKNIQVGSEDVDERKKFHASYPKTEFDFINQAEEKFTQDYFNEFKKNSQGVSNQSIGGIDYGQHFELLSHDANFITFFIERYISFGNNYDMHYFTHVYDVKNRKKIEISDLFSNKNDFKNFSYLVRDKAGKQIKNIIDNMPNQSESDKVQLWENLKDIFEKGTQPINNNFHAFTWDKDGTLTIYFDKYQIASGNFGSIKISLSPSEYKKLLSPKFQKLLNIKKEEEEGEVNVSENRDTHVLSTNVNCGEVPCVALTFDDGPSIYTNKLLDILKENDVKATFFVLGKSAKIQKNTILRTYKEGHQIGNHSWDHKNLKNLSKSAVEHQIYDTNDVIKNIIGEKPHLMRPPYGAMNESVKSIANMPIILWSLDPLDWKDKNAEIVAERMSKANKNGIVLAHDIHKTTVDAIPQVIKALKSKGYHLVTIDELFSGQKLENGKKYFKRK